MTHGFFLLQMAGTSGAGKSTLAAALARRTGAALIDYDVVKSAALDAGAGWDLAGRVGYGASRAIAGQLLSQGISVILDSPCRFAQIVSEGTALAAASGAAYAYIECVLADEAELRRRLASRPRQRSQRLAFDVPPPDAPNDAMADADGVIRVPPSVLPGTPWLRVDTGQPGERCLEQAFAYLASLAAGREEAARP